MNIIRLLDEGAGFDAEYADGLSNHRPMALWALVRLGATQAQLNRFDQHYRQRLRPAPPQATWPGGEPWALYLGRSEAWPLYRDLFWQWLLHEDAGSVLNQALPRLMQGCAGAAFHGLIRTAYAVQALHRRELADALAYWASCWADLGSPCAAGDTLEPETVLRQLRACSSNARLIAQRVSAAAQQPHFKATVDRLAVTETTLPRLSALAAHAYAASDNFTVLHLVTSAHAMRVLLPFVDEPVPAVQAYWRAFAAAVSSAGLQAGALPKARSWPALMAAACESNNDHVVKLVDSCYQQHLALGDAGPWQQAATRALMG